jgi:hypothetical protein
LVDRVEREVRTQTGAARIQAGVALHAEGFYLARGYRLVRRGTAWDGSAYLEMEKDLQCYPSLDYQSAEPGCGSW